MSSSSQGPCSVQTQLQVASNAGAAMGHAHTSRRSGGPRSCLGGLLVKMSHLPLVGQFAALQPSCWPEPETPGWCPRVAVQSEGPAKTPWHGAAACASRPRTTPSPPVGRVLPPQTTFHCPVPRGSAAGARGVLSRTADGSHQVRPEGSRGRPSGLGRLPGVTHAALLILSP